MKKYLYLALGWICKTFVFLLLLLTITRAIYFYSAYSPLRLIPVETTLAMYDYFDIGCCEAAADFDFLLSMLIALPPAIFTFWIGRKTWRNLRQKAKKIGT